MTYLTLETFIQYHNILMQQLHAMHQLIQTRANASSLESLRGQVSSQLLESPVTKLFPEDRTFFGDPIAAIAATAQLLSNTPPARYDLSLSNLPTTELLGQMHALHANLLEWLTHLDHNLSQLSEHVRAHLPDPDEPKRHTDFAAGLQALTEEVTRLAASCSNLAPNLAREIAALQPSSSAEAPLKVVELLGKILAAIPSAEPPVQPVALPPFQAAHPSANCRTYGFVTWNDRSVKLLLDVVGLPRSTAYELSLLISEKASHTDVTASLSSSGVPVLFRQMSTPHQLTSLPGDALALLHANCPSFIYKFNRANIC